VHQQTRPLGGAEIFVSKSGDLSEGGRKIITYGRHRIGVVRAKGRLFAYRNVCPHQGGPICGGLLIHKVEAIIDEDKTYRGMRFPGTRCTSCAPGMGRSSTSKPAAAPGTAAHPSPRRDSRTG
jgi:Rieske [2Fe-2S] domain